MKTYFNYANLRCYTAQKLSHELALTRGGFDQTLSFSVNDIDGDFQAKHQAILSKSKGAGLWLWKYYLANMLLSNERVGARFGNDYATLHAVPEDSWICYADSDMNWIEPVDHLIACAERDATSIMIFRGRYKTENQCHPDVLAIMRMNLEMFTQTNEHCAGIFLFKKNDESRLFFRDVLEHMTDQRLIDADWPRGNDLNIQLPPGFMRHADDQAVFSLMTKRYGFYPYRYPNWSAEQEEAIRVKDETEGEQTCYGYSPPSRFTRREYPERKAGRSTYPRLIEHTQNHELHSDK